MRRVPGSAGYEGVMVREAATKIAAMTEHSGSEEGTCAGRFLWFYMLKAM